MARSDDRDREQRVIQTLIVAARPDLRSRHLAAINAHPDIEIVGTATDVASGLRLAEQHRPDVIVLDEAMTGEGVASHIPTFRAARHSAAIIVLGAATDLGHVERCISAGAAGYALDDAPNELVAAIRSTTLHGIWLCPRIAAELVAQERIRLKGRMAVSASTKAARHPWQEFG
jgi:two-component system response regulator NreC